MESKVIELGKKLLALAERGVDGEKLTAQALLEKYLAKHNITIEDIEGEKVDYWYLIFRGDAQIEMANFFKQVCASVVGTEREKRYLTLKEIRALGIKNANTCQVIKYYCTPSEKIEILETHAFFKVKYKEDKEIFYSAFIQKNQLYSNPFRTERGKGDKSTSIEDLLKMELMASAMQKHTLVKKLNQG